MMTLRLWIYLAAAIAICGLIGGAYMIGRSDGKAIEQASQAREDRVRLETRELAEKAAADAISKIEVKHVVIRQKLETQIRDNPVYSDCFTDQRVLDSVNEAITGYSPSSGGELPAADTDERQDVR